MGSKELPSSGLSLVLIGIFAYSRLNSFCLGTEEDLRRFVFWVKNNRGQVSELLKGFSFPQKIISSFSALEKSRRELIFSGILNFEFHEGKTLYGISDASYLLEILPQYFSEEEIPTIQRMGEDFYAYERDTSFKEKVIRESRVGFEVREEVKDEEIHSASCCSL